MTNVNEFHREEIDKETIETVKAVGEKYKYGFVTDVEMEFAPRGISEDIVRLISEKNDEPAWMLEWRLSAYRRWQRMQEPDWAMVREGRVENSIRNGYRP